MSSNSIESILIVGGGSAGWITACLLQSYLGKNIEISLVESPDIPAIGVGEATVPSIRNTLATIGISEKQFMSETDATFKSLIRFKDWNLGDYFDHPFDRRQRPATDNDVKAWLSQKRSGADFTKYFSLLSSMSDHNIAPKGIGWADYESAFPYAYHLDAVKLAATLQKHGVSKGIKHGLNNIQTVELTSDGQIEKVVAEDGSEYTASLYIDCTGFSARLASLTSPKTVDYSDNLICDRAVTLQVPYDVHKPEKIRPYTLASARSAGWNWDINLQGRRGVGYVYSGQHQSDEEAEAELRDYEGAHSEDLSTRLIKFKTFKRSQSWSQNCISIGLSDGFIEPLESTGLYMIEFAAHMIGKELQESSHYSVGRVRHYNRVMQSLYDECVDFVALHYLTSKRDDTEFWKEATKLDRAPDRICDLLDLWKHRMLEETDFITQNRLFSFESFEFLLYGARYLSLEAQGETPFNYNINAELQKCYNALPQHEDWLAHSL